MEKGQFYGMGYIDENFSADNLSSIKNYLTPYPSNDYIKNLMHQYAGTFPERKLDLSEAGVAII